jgi:short-subunit dehydrogenase
VLLDPWFIDRSVGRGGTTGRARTVGLGAAIAQRFGREGFIVTLVARREQALADLSDDLRGAGVDVNTFTADAGDLKSFRTRLEEFAQQSAPGVVVYNAALLTSDGILTNDATHFASAYAVDVLGAVTAAQVFTPAMRRAGAGTFLVTGGGLGIHPHRDYASISVGKAALRAATTLLHDELKDDGVHAAVSR